jgi:hypothetical protein
MLQRIFMVFFSLFVKTPPKNKKGRGQEMRLEIDERDTIELIVNFKERLNRLEEKIDAILSLFSTDEDVNDPICQPLPGGVANVIDGNIQTYTAQDLDTFSIYSGGVIPTAENLCLYGTLQFLDIEIEGEEDDTRRFIEY